MTRKNRGENARRGFESRVVGWQTVLAARLNGDGSEARFKTLYTNRPNWKLPEFCFDCWYYFIKKKKNVTQRVGKLLPLCISRADEMPRIFTPGERDVWRNENKNAREMSLIITRVTHAEFEWCADARIDNCVRRLTDKPDGFGHVCTHKCTCTYCVVHYNIIVTRSTSARSKKCFRVDFFGFFFFFVLLLSSLGVVRALWTTFKRHLMVRRARRACAGPPVVYTWTRGEKNRSKKKKTNIGAEKKKDTDPVNAGSTLRARTQRAATYQCTIRRSCREDDRFRAHKTVLSSDKQTLRRGPIPFRSAMSAVGSFFFFFSYVRVYRSYFIDTHTPQRWWSVQNRALPFRVDGTRILFYFFTSWGKKK
jgi:hypothetical protein